MRIDESVTKYWNLYICETNNLWSFADSVLYDLCYKYPDHISSEQTIAKLYIIGRVYAAPLERQKATGQATDSHYIAVANNLKGLDCLLQPCFSENAKEIHFAVMKMLCGENNTESHRKCRSLASKYLHFHKPDVFYIYDSRVQTAITKLVHKERGVCQCNNVDKIYSDFVDRMQFLSTYLTKEFSRIITPKELDNFLLYVYHKLG